MNYVMSDIHGNIPRFESIMEQINLQPEDTLYILGDVIDRYPNGIKLLRRVMAMPNIKMLLGNHEYMMLQAIGDCKDAAEEKERYVENAMAMSRWYRNGGEVTHQQIKHIRKSVRAEILQFIDQLPLNIDVEVNGIKYKLVHGSPVENYEDFGWNRRDYPTVRDFAVWNRWDECQYVPEGYIMIFGHTPTHFFRSISPLEIWTNGEAIGIDCGCGYFDGRLACIRLEDMKVFYSKDEPT